MSIHHGRLLCALLLLGSSSPAAAQYSKVVVFGDSGSDSGYYKTTPPMSNPLPPATPQPLTVPPGAGRFTTNPGLNWTQMVAQNFGLPAEPSNVPGGTNYAVGGARVSGTGVPTVTFANVPSVRSQIASYLAGAGGSADRNALHILMAGGNDNAVAAHLHPNSLVDQLAITTRAAADLVDEIRRLHAAGARHFVIANLFTSPNVGRGTHVRNDTFNQVLYNGITAAGIYVIRANVQGLMFGVYANPAAYGIITSETILIDDPACVPNAVNQSFETNQENALWCLAANLTATTPDPANDHLFADRHGHFTTAGQRIIANFVFNLVKGPGPLAASVQPYGRSMPFGKTAGATATVKNTGNVAATGCTVALPPGIPATLSYRAVDAGNQPIKPPDTPVDIDRGATQKFTFAITPILSPSQIEIGIVFDCSNTPPADVVPGLNTFIVTAAPASPPDLDARVVLPADSDIVTAPLGGSVSFKVTATNSGASGSITASVDDGGRKLGVATTICRMNTGATTCLAPPETQATSAVAANTTVTYRVTAKPTAALPLDIALNRLFVRLRTADGFTRGAASAAITTQ